MVGVCRAAMFVIVVVQDDLPFVYQLGVARLGVTHRRGQIDRGRDVR